MQMLGFGEKLKELREKSGLTQDQLAARIGIGKSTVAMYEGQGRLPSAIVLLKMARTFHVSTDYLLGADQVQRLELAGLTEEDIDLLERMCESMRKKNKIIKKNK